MTSFISNLQPPTARGGAARTLAWNSAHICEGASLCPAAGGAVDLRGPAAPWAYALAMPLDGDRGVDQTTVGVRFVVDLEVLSGHVGLFAGKHVDGDPLGDEQTLAPAGRVTVRVDGDTSTWRLCIRNRGEGGTVVRLHSMCWYVRRAFDITSFADELLPILLKHPGAVALEAIASAISVSAAEPVEPDEIGALECGGAPLPMPFDRLWDDPLGRCAADTSRGLIELLETYDPSKRDPRHGYGNRKYTELYLTQSTMRVYHLARELEAAGVGRGSILEIGSYFGQFALTLQRLGYRVTAVDRYRAFNGALDAYVSYLRGEGVEVIETDPDGEGDAVERLGAFDAVVAMAVVEHIPHTPREFLRRLAAHVTPGGLLALDTPNHARYWNRKRLATGLSTYQPIEKQFYAGIPYEGHHREYTATELIWMLEQVGCRDIRCRMFDYNLLQFTELWPDHLQALLAMTVDPMLADTMLAIGRLGGSRSEVV
jgi:2-polyprenyl-3-methyl-5-hydroxy-6-metoxy-1,4-benzoquinol methylase